MVALDFSANISPPHYNNLLSAIEREECAIFIGSGLSVPVGYPSLQMLLNQMANEAGIVDLQAKEIDQNWTNDFQTIKEALGPAHYADCLRNIFDHRKRDIPYNPILINILNVPFCAFVTTNYDPCLEFAHMNSSSGFGRHSFSYPNLPTTELKSKHIFHPHGYFNPKDANSINSIILSQDEFSMAYETDEITSTFLRELFWELDVLFIGFGWNDIEILGILERVKQKRQLREDITIKRNLPLSRERSKFADRETLLTFHSKNPIGVLISQMNSVLLQKWSGGCV
jgi:hypothetical protein